MNVSRIFTAVLLVAAFASPGVAADNRTPALATLSKASQALLTRAARDTSAQANQQTPPATNSGQFFRSKKGTAVVALLAAGFAYTLYSRFHDEIKSPIREQ